MTSHTVENYLRNASTATICRIAGDGYAGATADVSSSIDGNWLGGNDTHFASGSGASKATASFQITANGADNWFAIKRPGRSADWSIFHLTGSPQAGLITDTSNIMGVGSSSTNWQTSAQQKNIVVEDSNYWYIRARPWYYQGPMHAYKPSACNCAITLQ